MNDAHDHGYGHDGLGLDGFGGDPWAEPVGPSAMDQAEAAPTPDAAGGAVDAGDVAEGVVGTLAAYVGFKAVRNWWRHRGDPEPAAPAPSSAERRQVDRGAAIEQPPERTPNRVATTPARDEGTRRAREERAVLVDLCVELEDLLPQPALREKVHRALAKVGVTASEPVGDIFDPEHHCSVGSMPTGDPELHDHVASVERCGFNDHGRELRIPDVIVWRYDATCAPAGTAREQDR
jgi:hypothetical protein